MSTQPCDQIAADIFEVQTEFGCTLDYEEVFFLLSVVEQQYSKPFTSFSELLDRTLDVYLLSENGSREAYKQVLGKIFGRRSAYKQKENSKRGRHAPFAPR